MRALFFIFVACGTATIGPNGNPYIADPRPGDAGVVNPANCPNGTCACSGGNCNGKCAEPVCDSAGVCTPACKMECSGGNCGLDCSQKGPCTMECSGGNCLTYCGSGLCNVQCSGGHCNTSCPPNGNCIVDCSGGGCSIACAAGAKCSFSNCSGGGCTCTGAGCQ